VALAVLTVLSACLVGIVAHSRAAHAQGAGPYPQATLFRPDGQLATNPATVTLPDIGTAVFTLGTDGSIWWSTADTNWASLGRPVVSTELIPQTIIGEPAVVSWGPGRIDVFVEAGNVSTQPGYHKLWQTFTTCSGCSWSPWIQPVPDGTLASPPSVTSWAPGRIDVAVVGTDGNIWLRDWDTDAWSPGWLLVPTPGLNTTLMPDASLAGSYFPPAVVGYTPGRLDIFIEGTDKALWQTFFIDNTWQGWFQPTGTSGGVLNSPPVAEWWDGDGELDLSIFVQGTDLHLYQTTYTPGGWTPWTVEGTLANTFIGAPAVATTLSEVPYVLVRGNDLRAYEYIPS
jgi:serine protease AprX